MMLNARYEDKDVTFRINWYDKLNYIEPVHNRLILLWIS